MPRLLFLIKFITILLGVLLHGSISFSQSYNFINYSSDAGFSDSQVNALWKDTRGNLWIGTAGQGLARFDSHDFHWFGEEDGLTNSFINAICNDKAGNLWIGTDQGVFVYDGRKFHKEKFLSDQKINTIVKDRIGTIWLGTEAKGIYKYDGKSTTPLKATINTAINGRIDFLFADRSDLWISTELAIIKYSKNNFTSFPYSQGNLLGKVNNISRGMDGRLWFATDKGVRLFDGKKFINVPELETLKVISTLMHDAKGHIWLGGTEGIYKFDDERLHQYEDPSQGQKKAAIICSYKDRDNNLWFGTTEGLRKLDGERFTHYQDNDRMGKRVYSIVEAINGNIICGTSLGGTTVFNGEQYTLLNQREGFSSSVVQCFYYSADSSLWIGTQDDGIYKFAKSGMQHYTYENGLPIDNITGFTEDIEHNVWIASADSGVAVVRTANDSIHLVKRYTNGQSITSNKINAIASDGSAIWIGTADAGIIKINHGQTEKINTATASNENTIHAIVTDSLGRVYIASSHGVDIYDGSQSRHLTRSDGLSSNVVYSLTIDRKRNLWAGTERGVDRITLTDLAAPAIVRHFGLQEGFKGVEVYRNSSCIDRKGNVWFGTINGLVKYDPQEDHPSSILPIIHITGIQLFFDNIEETPYGDSLLAWYPIPVQLNLPYNQNNLTFNFAGIYHQLPQAVKYRWILEGFSKDWSPALSEAKAIFSNLPPGSYTFKVIACNEDNVWTKVPATYRFSIASPIWQRWWFVVIIVLLTAGIISIGFYSRLLRVKTKNKVIQEKLEMEKSILQLEQEAARLQMNPHFIFNCLNSIQGFISVNDPFQAKKYLAKFAKLMRLILENAREEFIPLENEVNILDNYLELEKLSTHLPFEFSITFDEKVDPSRIQIPPMMIQPFVENAIVHGLRKKEVKGTIHIHFKLDDDLLLCTILDNGIGRHRASELNARSLGQHKSSAIPITEKRLEQYGTYLNVKARVEIIDLIEDGVATGTKVIVSTPYETF